MSARLLALLALVTACDTLTPPEGSDDAAPTDTSPTADTGPATLAPQDYTLQVDAGATTTRWKFGNGISAILCATLTDDGADRTLRIYGATVTADYAPYCVDSGAYEHTALRFRGNYIQTPGKGWVTIDGSVTGTIVSGATRFDDDQTAELVVDVSNPKDATIAPARLSLTVSTSSTELTFTFAEVE